MQENKNGTYPLYLTTQWGFVFSVFNRKYTINLIGPRLQPASVKFRANEHFMGIVFHGGAIFKGMAKTDMLNQIMPIPVIGRKEFVIQEKTFQIPTYENLDTLVEALVENEIILTAPIAAVSHRDKQRKLKRFIGLSPKQIEQANRVEQAIELLSRQVTISAAASHTGFADQAHMTRDFRRFVGLTPQQVSTFFKNSNNL